MALNNVLYVDDEADWRRIVQAKFKQRLAKTVDVARDYISGVAKIKKKFYDLVVVDGLDGNCFRLIDDVKDVSHGPIAIFSSNSGIRSKAMQEGIPFYNKPMELDKIVRTYKK